MKKEKLSNAQRLRIKAKKASLNFKREFKKAIVTALVSALGLILAFSWKDVLDLLVKEILSFSPIKSSLLSAIIITIFCVAGILILSRFGNEKTK
jgi:hypothetical protein